MNPARFIHVATVSRHAETITAGKKTQAWSVQFASVRCLVEGLPSRERRTILGKIPGAAYTFTWGSEAIREGDRIVFNGQTFIIRDITHDTTRPTGAYQTGLLERKPVTTTP